MFAISYNPASRPSRPYCGPPSILLSKALLQATLYLEQFTDTQLRTNPYRLSLEYVKHAEESISFPGKIAS